jgi:hypothetical protein
MDIEELQKKVIEFRDARDSEQYHNPKDRAISLILEAAEPAEPMDIRIVQLVNEVKKL